ncbi:hypothetical protein K2173_024116 [Erythroxylum novogranatense]|uniref:Uncharacterized protein n=1 Tax=Erythroxylum novogranatense TaxID=1862640 RepID=A0AAV8S5A1_9ROSI|nr:hypothetical protein K2173_024116 [Erythroxylum novogranatense]
MAVSVSESEKGGSNREDVLKPFYKRASEAEDRLSRLEVALSSKKDSGNEELLKTVSELQSKLEGANTLLALKQEKIDKLVAENTKLNYRIIHLLRAIREADAKFESLKGGSEATVNTISKLEDLRL